MSESVDVLFNLFVIALLLLSNGFFVASEFAIVKVRKTRIEQLVNEGNSTASVVLDAIKDMDKSIASVQLGVTISSIGLGWVGQDTLAELIEPLFSFLPGMSQTIAAHSISVSIAFALITFLHVVIGELVPKSIALEFTEKTALIIARPMNAITFIFNPFIWLLNGFGNFLLKILHIPHSHRGSLVHSTEELDMLVDASYDGGVLNKTEKDMLHNVFKFSDLTAKQVMIPRTDMVCVPIDMSFDELNDVASQNQFTRYPVYNEDIDDITGFIHVKDLYLLSLKDEERPIEKIQRPIMMVPETMTLDNLVREFKKRKVQVAIVIDEFGGTSGLITLEDVIEEIVGDVQDEFDEEEEVNIQEINKNTYEVNAMFRLDEMAEYFDMPENSFEDEDVDTVGGLVMKILDRLAKVGDCVSYNDLTFTVKEVDGARITKLEIKREPPKPVAEETQAQ
ncbi:MAG: hemolysin family protein [Clostridiaceae bacterium]|jgi:putative hemolysin|nr:hemolysin family protein [Clostridiaceae bacterium]